VSVIKLLSPTSRAFGANASAGGFSRRENIGEVQFLSRAMLFLTTYTSMSMFLQDEIKSVSVQQQISFVLVRF
jgi:hypothetical protein